MAPKIWGVLGAAEAVPAEIGRRQFYQAIANRGMISKEEALAAIGGVIPPAIEALIEQIQDEDIAFDARCMFAGALAFARNHPYVEFFGAMMFMTPVMVDNLWREAARLN